jgi:hypothetical protein
MTEKTQRIGDVVVGLIWSLGCGLVFWAIFLSWSPEP